MERDTRLVYTVDCVMNDSGEVGPGPQAMDSTLIKVYRMKYKVYGSLN